MVPETNRTLGLSTAGLLSRAFARSGGLALVATRTEATKMVP